MLERQAPDRTLACMADPGTAPAENPGASAGATDPASHGTLDGSGVGARVGTGGVGGWSRIWAPAFGLALAIRLAFAGLAPGRPAADGFFYDQYARLLLQGAGYVNLDGSPAIRWMPGWPAVLSTLYRVFGDAPVVAMTANALFDAATAGLVAVLGARLFGATTGRSAGLLYALWPGMVYYVGTFFVEPLFNLLFTGALLLLAIAAEANVRRTAWFAAAGVALGLCTWVKAEPPTLAPALIFFVWRVRASGADFVRQALAVGLLAGLLIAPWTIRNYQTFGRFIPTSASGAISAHLSNHPGAHGGQDFLLNRQLQARYKGRTSAETTMNRYDAGFRDAWQFARDHPREQVAIFGSKLVITYGGDAQGARTLRGSGPPEQWHVAPATWRALTRLANSWWFAMLGLAALGTATLARWPRGAGALLLGPVATWLALHVLFLAGQRYHAPQVPELAVVAAVGIDRARALWASFRARR